MLGQTFKGCDGMENYIVGKIGAWEFSNREVGSREDECARAALGIFIPCFL